MLKDKKISDSRREAFLDIAEELFADLGYENTSIDRLIKLRVSVEASLDFPEEDDVGGGLESVNKDLLSGIEREVSFMEREIRFRFISNAVTSTSNSDPIRT